MSHLVPSPRRARRSTPQEEGNVGAKRRCHLPKPFIHEPQPEQPVHAYKKPRGVAASAPEPRPDRNALCEPYADPAPIVPRLLLDE